jgi:translation initiation factor IF-2
VTEVKKKASKKWEKKKELYVLREELRETQTRRSSETAARSCKARAVIAGPVQVGKIDLNPKKAAAVAAQLIQLEVPPIVAAKWKHRKQNFDRKPVVKEKSSGKVVAEERGESCYRDKEPVKEPVKRRKEKAAQRKGDLCRGSDYYSVSKIVGN